MATKAIEIQTAILTHDLTIEEVSMLIQTLSYKRNQIGSTIKNTLRKGDKVSYTGKNGYTVGIVEKVAIKNVTVNVNGLSWRDPASMLTPVAAI